MVTVRLVGRLGNQMFQYAVCRSVAQKRNYNFYIPTDTDASTEGQHIKNFFDNIELGLKDGEISHKFLEDTTTQKFNEEVLKVHNFTEFRGFFQSSKYFSDIKSDVKSWFKIKTFEESKIFLEKFDVEKYCYIHLRGTDYKNHGHIFLQKDYYEKAMETVKSKFPNISFVIITDDTISAKEMFPEIQSFRNEDMMIDFEILYKSKINIIPNSTFSWWSSYLGEKYMVVAPNYWWNYYKPELGFYPNDIKTEEFTYI